MSRASYLIFTVTIVCIFSMSIISFSSDDTVPNIGTRYELFVDNYIIDSMTGVRQILHKPIPREVVIVHDEPWEGSACAYHTVFQDGSIYRMYYTADHLNVDDDGIYTPSISTSTEPHLSFVPHPLFGAYAESRDGKSWIKPELGLFEFKGSKKK